MAGEHGQLSVDAEGNYSYMANQGAPENVRDRFVYTLADNQGNSDTAALIVEIGKTPAVIKADAQQIVPGPDGVVTLPPGVELSDIMVVGRNLVVNMPDGTQLIIIDGAVFVPQLVLGGVEVPATNVATLLIGQEPQPAAGELPPSSGGNFALPPPPLDPGIPLGDLIPPTEYTYQPPEPQEVLDVIDNEPTIVIQPDGQPAAVNAVDVVDEAGLPVRPVDEPEGSGEEAAAGADGDTSEATAGTIIIDSPDGVDSVTINGVVVTGVIGQQIAGDFGTLTITGFAGDNILYSYVLNDNTSGDDTHDDFEVVLTDSDGDVAIATLVIDIIDDVPTARDDTDAVVKGDTSTDGNVMTGVGTTNSPAGVDTVGADDAEVTGVHAGTSGSFITVPDGGVTVVGQFGDLTIFPDGSYTYELHAEVGDGGNDVFTYQLTDGDGDTDPATLTITVPPDLKPTLDAPNVGEAGTIVDEAGLPPRGSEPEGTGEGADGLPNNESDDSEITTGTINFTPGDSPATITINGVVVTGVGQTFAGDYGTLEITGFNANGSITYVYTLEDNVDHDSDLTPFEEFDIVITDVDGDQASDTLRIDIINDAPIARDDTDSVVEGESTDGNVLTGVGTTSGAAGADTPGADDYAPNTVVGVVAGDTNTNVINGTGVGVNVVGTWGTLVLNADGSYTYNANADTDPPPGSQDVFTYTIIDNDGNATNATLTIDVIDDLTPVANTPDLVIVDDDDVIGANGNPGGPGDDAPQNETGFLTGSGGDGDLDFFFDVAATDAGLPAGFDLDPTSTSSNIIITQGGLAVLTITLNTETGAYTVTQNNPIDHETLNGLLGDDTENNTEDFNIVFFAQDEDGDPSDPANLTIQVDDDTPVADDEASVTGLVDEDDLPAGNDDVEAGDDDPGNADGDNDGTTTGGAAGSLFALFSFGADQPGSISLSTDTSGLPVLHSNGVLVTYAVVGDTLTASAGGSTVFTLTVNADGSWDFDLEGQLDHPTADTEDDIDIDFSSIIIGEDNDGDEVTAADGTFVVTVDDDLPVPADADQVTGEVDEDALADGNNDSADGDDPGGTTASGLAGSLLSLFSIGADQPGTVSLSTDTSGLQALTSNGHDVLYDVVGGVLTAYVDADDSGTINGADTEAFTLTVNADGSWEFELLDQLDHPIADTEDNLLLDFSSIIVAEDADGDTATLPADSFVIDVDDDMPVAFDPDPITTGVENKAGETATADLDVDGNIDDNVGADQPGTVTFANIVDDQDSGLESGGDPIKYYLSEDGQTLEAKINAAPDGTGGTLIFTIELNQDQGPGDDTYTITMFGTIDNGAGVTFDDLTSTAAGNVPYRGVGADDPLTTVDLLLSAGPNPATTVNTDSDSIGAANQSMDAGETIRIDFVTNLEDDPADDDVTFPTGFTFGNHVSTNSFIGFIPQVQGSQTETVAFTVYALDTSDTDADEPDRDPTGGFTNSTITTITEVTVQGFDVGEDTPVTLAVSYTDGTTFVPVAYGISVRVNADGSVTFSGIQEGDSYGFSTGANDFNAVVVESEPAGTGGASEDSFDLGVFSIGIVDTGDPINLSYDLELTDADGDSVLVTDALQITIAPDAGTQTLTTLAATSESTDTSSFSLLASDSQDQQLQKTAANSNTLTLAAAVAAAGLGSEAAAFGLGQGGHGQGSEIADFYVAKALEQFSANDDGGDAAVSLLAPEPAANDSAPADSSSSSSDSSSSSNSVDVSPAPAAEESSASSDAGDQGPAQAAADAGPVAPTVAMVSAEALQAAGLENAQQGGAVEQIVADALGAGDAPTVDAVLANLPGAVGELAAISHMASPAAEAVSGWDMAGHGAIGAGFDVMFKVDVAMHHQDAVQPAVNG